LWGVKQRISFTHSRSVSLLSASIASLYTAGTVTAPPPRTIVIDNLVGARVLIYPAVSRVRIINLIVALSPADATIGIAGHRRSKNRN